MKSKKQKTHSKAVKSNQARDTKFIVAGILLLAIIVFSPSINNSFLVNWDDDGYILKNELLKNLSWKNIKTIFTTFHMDNYHPLTTISNAIEYKIFGLNPKPFHIINILFHLSNVVLVFIFIKLLTAKVEIASIVSLFFAVHPMHVESVAWISERKDVLYSFFYLSSLIFWLKKQEAETLDNSTKKLFDVNYQLSIFFFLCSLFSKSMAVTLPVVLVLVDYYRGNLQFSGFRFRMLIKYIPFFVLSIVFGLTAMKSQGATGAIQDFTPIYSVLDRILLTSYGIVFYIFHLFIPYKLSAIHLFPKKIEGLLPYEYYVAPFILILLLLGVLKSGKHRKDFIFGILFFLTTASVVLQIIPVGRAVVAERYTYLPYLGLLLIVGKIYGEYRTIKPRLTVVLIMFSLLLSLIAYNRNKVWKDSVTLFSDVVEKYPDGDYGHFALAVAKNYTGDTYGALDQYAATIRVNPNFTDAYYNRADIRERLNDINGAMSDYTDAIRIDSTQSKLYYNRGNLNMKIKNYQNAISDYTMATHIDSMHADAYNNMANAKEQLQDINGALESYNYAIRAKPDFSMAYNNRGILKNRMRDYQGACRDWQMALSLGNRSSENLIRQYCNQAIQ